MHFKWRFFLPAWLWQRSILFCAVCSLSQILWRFTKQSWVGDVKLSIRAVSYDANPTLCLGRECELTFAALGFYNHELFHVESEGNSNPVALELIVGIPPLEGPEGLERRALPAAEAHKGQIVPMLLSGSANGMFQPGVTLRRADDAQAQEPLESTHSGACGRESCSCVMSLAGFPADSPPLVPACFLGPITLLPHPFCDPSISFQDSLFLFR